MRHIDRLLKPYERSADWQYEDTSNGIKDVNETTPMSEDEVELVRKSKVQLEIYDSKRRAIIRVRASSRSQQTGHETTQLV